MAAQRTTSKLRNSFWVEMFDTVASKHCIAYPPNEMDLRSLDWQVFYDKRTGNLAGFSQNEKENGITPRLTIAQTPKKEWFIKAEASLPKLLRGMNIPLIEDNEIEGCFCLISELVEVQSGFRFEAHNAPLCRVDFARDINVGESAIMQIIDNIGRVQIPRYNRIRYCDSGVEFVTKGRKPNKRIKVYHKLAEVIERNGSNEEQQMAHGILRVEIQLRTSAINGLVEKLRLPNRQAQYVLTREVSDHVLKDALEKVQFNSIKLEAKQTIQKLHARFDINRTKSLLGFLELKELYGEDFYKLPYLKCSRRTYFRDLADCRRAGVLVYE